MIRSSRVIPAIVVVVFISTIGLIWVQFALVYKTFQANKEVFEQKIEVASGLLSKLLEKRPQYRQKLVDEIAHDQRFSPEVKASFEYLLDSVIQNGIGLQYTLNYGIYAHLDEHNLYKKVFGDATNETLEVNKCDGSCTKNYGWLILVGSDHHHGEGSEHDDHYHLGIFFPEPNNFIFSEMRGFFILSTLFLLFILVCFASIIITVRRQRKLSDMKNDFINNLTHEFKTPIFSIDLAAGMLKKAKEIQQSEKLGKYVDVISTEGHRLKNQVDKVLQMAIVDSGNFKLEIQEIDLHELIEKVADNFKVIIAEQEGSLTLDLQATKYNIWADEIHLKNVVYNLLDNAQKYSLDNARIIVSTRDTAEGVEISVSDQGIGMDEASQGKIFEKFYRADTSDIHNVKGFGLGLSYVKSVIEAHGATIGLKSKLNHGTTFTIQFKA